MDSNTYSTASPTVQAGRPPTQQPGGHPTQQPTHPPAGPRDGLATLNVALDQLATETGDLDRLPDRAQRVLQLGQLRGRLDGQWLAELAAVDACGAAGADQGPVRRHRRLAPPAPAPEPGRATSAVRTARARFRGPLPRTAQAVTNGELPAAHAQVLAAGTHDLPSHTTTEAEPVLVEAARRLDPPRRRRPSQPLDVGRTTRVVTPTQRTAHSVRDRGCVFPGCQRPLSWCEAHQLVPVAGGWPDRPGHPGPALPGPPPDRHEGGWRLGRGPDGRLTATPPHRPPHRRHPAAA